MTKRNRFFLAAFLAATLMLTSACEPRRILNESDTTAMKKTDAASTTHCFGRYLVDLPNKLVMHKEGGQNIEAVQLDVMPMDQTQFDVAVAVRLRELQNMFMSGPEKYPLLRRTIEVPAPHNGVVFDRAEDPDTGGRISRQLELWGWKNGYRISAKIKAIDPGFPEDAGEPALRTLHSTVQANLARLLDVFSRTTGRGDSLPSGQGVCILNGFVSGPPTGEESVTLLYYLEGMRDAFFRFNTDSRHTRDDTLVERSKKFEPLLAENHGRTVRRAGRASSAFSAGEEFLYAIRDDAIPDNKAIMRHKFVFEANSAIGSAATPLILVNFEAGELLPGIVRDKRAASTVPTAPSVLSEAEAVSLWDAVIPTIRLRPGAF